MCQVKKVNLNAELTDEKEWDLKFGKTLDMLCVLLSMPPIVVEHENIIIESRHITFRKSFSKNIVLILPERTGGAREPEV